LAKIPHYQEVYNNLRKQISGGEYVFNDYLPTETQLEEIFQVSRTTIRKAIDMLVKDGFLEVRQGRGTRVLDYQYTQNLNRVTSTSETLSQKGYAVTTKDIFVEIIPAPKRIVRRLGLAEGAEVCHIQRVQLADNVPTAIMANYIDAALVPGLAAHADKIVSLYSFLEAEYGIYITSAEDVITAKTADFVESQMLGVKTGTALLFLKRIAYQNRLPISFDETTVRADIYQYEIQISGR
jgi:GntR family transcriptional regulator